MSQRNPYEVLGIGADATGADITRAYRRLARAAHPDSRPGDSAAAAEFRVVSDAYALLSDPARRATYDRHHPPPAQRPHSRGPAPGPVAVPASRRARTDGRPGARRGPASRPGPHRATRAARPRRQQQAGAPRQPRSPDLVGVLAAHRPA